MLVVLSDFLVHCPHLRHRRYIVRLVYISQYRLLSSGDIWNQLRSKRRLPLQRTNGQNIRMVRGKEKELVVMMRMWGLDRLLMKPREEIVSSASGD
jgi:hypothetical protein